MSEWKSNKTRDSLNDSIIAIHDGINNKQWRFDFIQYLDMATRTGSHQFFWQLIPMIRFVQGSDGIAWTDIDCNVFLNAPHEAVPADTSKWEFIYYHECLHQLFETFEVGEQIKKNEGECNHELLNVASDCIINEHINRWYNMDYPTQNFITPEYLKETYDIEYDRKTDDQYALYMKMINAWEQMKDDLIIRAALDDMPDVDATIESGSNETKTKKIPTSDEWKAGSKAARKAANDILEKICGNIQKQANGKISVDAAVAAINQAMTEIEKLLGNSSKKTSLKEFFNMHVMDSAKFIFESDDSTTTIATSSSVDQKYSTYEQGWDYAIDSVLKEAEQRIQELQSTGGGGGKPVGKGQVQEVPENDPTEEEPFLPKPNMKSDNSNKDNSDNSDDQNGSDSGDQDSQSNDNQESQSNGNQDPQSKDDSTSDIDNMSGEEAAEDAKKNAEDAKESAEKAKQKADEIENEYGSDSKEAKAARKKADKTQKAADNAQEAADNAQEAADRGDDKTAKKNAKKARSKAQAAKSEANNMSEITDQNNSDSEDSKESKTTSSQDDITGTEKTDKENKSEEKSNDAVWDTDSREKETDEDAALNKAIREYCEDNIGSMTSEEAKKVIRKFTSDISGNNALGEFVNKCKDSASKSNNGIVVQTTFEHKNVSWATRFSGIVKNTVKQKVNKKRSEWERTFRRPNRRQGVIKDGDIIKKGKMRKKDKLTISIGFYIDCSGSMSETKVSNLFKFVYKLDSYLTKKYNRNAVVDGCIFDYYKFTVGVQRVTPPNIPHPGGSTDDLDELLNHIKNNTKDHMINVVMTDGQMNISPSSIKKQLDQLGGHVIFITEASNLEPSLRRVQKLCSLTQDKDDKKTGNKFDYIIVPGLNISAEDFTNNF